jgi:hypothetical protein
MYDKLAINRNPASQYVHHCVSAAVIMKWVKFPYKAYSDTWLRVFMDECNTSRSLRELFTICMGKGDKKVNFLLQNLNKFFYVEPYVKVSFFQTLCQNANSKCFVSNHWDFDSLIRFDYWMVTERTHIVLSFDFTLIVDLQKLSLNSRENFQTEKWWQKQ